MKRLLLSIGLFAALLVLMNWVYARWFYHDDLLKHSDIVEASWQVATDSLELVYLGESSNKTYGPTDTDHRKISEMLAEQLPGVRCGDITQDAAHAEVYYYLLKNIPKDSRVKTVVVTMNLRSFGANWIYSSLETALQKKLVMMKGYPPLMGRALLAFKAYPIHDQDEWGRLAKRSWEKTPLEFPYAFPYKTTAAWNRAVTNEGVKDSLGQRDQALTELTTHFIKNYGFQIHDDNPRVRDFDRIVKLAEQRGWTLVFNIMAENVDLAETLVGADLLFLMRQNVEYLMTRYTAKGILVVNNLEEVRDADFIDRAWPTEHYYQTGRQTIARKVAEAVQTVMIRKNLLIR